MARSISTILIAHCYVKDISQTKFVESFKKWKQRNLHTMFSFSIMEKKGIVGTFTHCANDTNYISGLPP